MNIGYQLPPPTGRDPNADGRLMFAAMSVIQGRENKAYLGEIPEEGKEVDVYTVRDFSPFDGLCTYI